MRELLNSSPISDSNARSTLIGDFKDNKSGSEFSDFVLTNGLCALNDKAKGPTFNVTHVLDDRTVRKTSHVDFSLVNFDLNSKETKWINSKNVTGLDHNAIGFNVSLDRPPN